MSEESATLHKITLMRLQLVAMDTYLVTFKTVTASSLLARAGLMAAQAILYGPGPHLDRLFFLLIMGPRWFIRFRPPAPPNPSSPPPLHRIPHPIEYQQQGQVFLAWSTTPSFVMAVEHASTAAVLLSEAIVLDPEIAQHISSGGRGGYGTPLERVFGCTYFLLIIASAISRSLHVSSSGLELSARALIGNIDELFDTEALINWILGTWQHS
ncbi:hypothetical protein M427DRAFT_389869 [Gonapodya prolifera JEL478]|uniref:Uncharacterized protein n=1 Tax=Gonapodya prolifera (strain JEL478) TaxID=1344416 RepID=A0A139A7T7_GONPJ|nr:hypothetical protein M427DRAFT_389869 [Gonapodya prolifera JEL478]|eukprot:KXS12866.1 hypothetical protein M427DRAFT_389869 [Gonapodya prolifera JEL478]